MENRKAEVKCADFKCGGTYTFDYTNYAPDNGGQDYEKVSCNKCGLVHTVIPWVVLTIDETADDGAYLRENTFDYYIQAQHTASNGFLTALPNGNVERPCPKHECTGKVTLTPTFSKESLQQNDGEFYEAACCDTCGSAVKTIPWIAAVSENDNTRSPEGHYMFPAWIL